VTTKWGGNKGLKKTASGSTLLENARTAQTGLLLTGSANRRMSSAKNTLDPNSGRSSFDGPQIQTMDIRNSRRSQALVDRVDNYPRDSSEEHKRVFEVLRELFADPTETQIVKNLKISPADLGLRFTMQEVSPVLRGLGAFDPYRPGGAVQIGDVFAQALPDDNGMISMAQFIGAMHSDTPAANETQEERESLRIAIEEKKAAEELARNERTHQAQMRAEEAARMEALYSQRAVQERMALEQQYAIQARREEENVRLLRQQQEFEEAQKERKEREDTRRRKKVAEARQKWKTKLLPMPWDAVVLSTELATKSES